MQKNWTEAETKALKVKALLRCKYGKPELAKRVVDFQSRYEEAMVQQRKFRSETTQTRTEAEKKTRHAVAAERRRILRVLFPDRRHRELASQRLETVTDHRDIKPEKIACPVCRKQTVNRLGGGELECTTCGAVWWPTAKEIPDENADHEIL